MYRIVRRRRPSEGIQFLCTMPTFGSVGHGTACMPVRDESVSSAVLFPSSCFELHPGHASKHNYRIHCISYSIGRTEKQENIFWFLLRWRRRGIFIRMGIMWWWWSGRRRRGNVKNLFGEEKTIRGTVREVSLEKNRVIVEEAP